MQRIETSQKWMCRATAYELLALSFLAPSKETANALAAGDFAAACSEVSAALEYELCAANAIPQLLSQCCGKDPEELYHNIRCEHTRLFVGERSPLITPFIGVWADERRGARGMLFVGEESVAIERFMRNRGVAKNLTAGQANDPVDHIGTVCEFLKYLCLVNAKAIRIPSGFLVDRGDYDEFASRYFVEYAFWCSERVAETTASPFYRAAALLLRETAGSCRNPYGASRAE